MNEENILTGRINQKRETRHRILATAQQMLATKATFSLEDVARQMNISRATIYRYFSRVDVLCAEAALSLRVKQPVDFSADVKAMSLRERLLYVQAYFNEHAHLHETALRKYLSVVLEESIKKGDSTGLRGARRPVVLEKVMHPYAEQISPQNYDRLKQIITVLSGIEPMITNKDVNGLSHEASSALLEWALEMILKGLGLEKIEHELTDDSR